MPNKTLHLDRFTNGLHLGSERTLMPTGTMRRNRGIHPVFDTFFRSRDGSTQLHALNAVHSLVYFSDEWYSAAATFLYKGLEQIKASLSGDRLSFTKMGPTAGVKDYLFLAGGGELFKAGDEIVDGTELITNGTMETDANWANHGTPATNERSTTQVFLGSYSRKFTPDAANEGIRGDAFTTVALAWYKITCWVYPDDGTVVTVRIRNGANDAYTYSVEHTGLTQDAWNEITFEYQETTGKGGAGAYIAFTSGSLTSGDWYVDSVSLQRAYYVTDWGIAVPDSILSAADGGAGGELDGWGDVG